LSVVIQSEINIMLTEYEHLLHPNVCFYGSPNVYLGLCYLCLIMFVRFMFR